MTDAITRDEREIANRLRAFDSIALIGVDATIKSMAAMMSVLEAREAEKDARIRELEKALRPFKEIAAKVRGAPMLDAAGLSPFSPTSPTYTLVKVTDVVAADAALSQEKK